VTTLHNEIFIDASPQDVWAVLARLDRLADYDPGVRTSVYTSARTEGVGATRHSEVPGGFFDDEVTAWVACERLELRLTKCSFPVRALHHQYELQAQGGGTRVRQLQSYEMKWGAVGRALDQVMVKRKWNAGVKAFLVGLKSEVEQSRGEQ